MEKNTCSGGKQSPAVSLVSLSNLLCGSLVAIVPVFTLTWLNLVESVAIFVIFP